MKEKTLYFIIIFTKYILSKINKMKKIIKNSEVIRQISILNSRLITKKCCYLILVYMFHILPMVWRYLKLSKPKMILSHQTSTQAAHTKSHLILKNKDIVLENWKDTLPPLRCYGFNLNRLFLLTKQTIHTYLFISK